LPGYYLSEQQAQIAVLRESASGYELLLQTGERRAFAAVRPDKFPVSILAGNLDDNGYTDIAIIKKRSPQRFVWNVYYNPLQSDKRRRRRFGSGEGQPMLARKKRGNRELISGYLPLRGQRPARIRFLTRPRVLRFESIPELGVDFSKVPASLNSGYYFDSMHFSHRGKLMAEMFDSTRDSAKH
jgi:hypothetical protein